MEKSEKEKMIVEYIRKGYPGKRVVKDGVEYVQLRRGPRIGVFVALNAKQFGWSLVHLKGENKEPAKDVSWGKGVELAVVRAKNESSMFGITDQVPGSIRKQFDDFKKRAIRHFTEEVTPIKGTEFYLAVSSDGEKKHYNIGILKHRGRLHFTHKEFLSLYSAMLNALPEQEADPDDAERRDVKK